MSTRTKIVLATALVLSSSVAALMATVPASAQVFYSNDPAAGDGSEAAAVPAYGGNNVNAFGYVDSGRQSATPRGHVAPKRASSKSAPKGSSASDD